MKKYEEYLDGEYVQDWIENDIKSWVQDYGTSEEEIEEILSIAVGESYSADGIYSYLRVQ